MCISSFYISFNNYNQIFIMLKLAIRPKHKCLHHIRYRFCLSVTANVFIRSWLDFDVFYFLLPNNVYHFFWIILASSMIYGAEEWLHAYLLSLKWKSSLTLWMMCAKLVFAVTIHNSRKILCLVHAWWNTIYILMVSSYYFVTRIV